MRRAWEIARNLADPPEAPEPPSNVSLDWDGRPPSEVLVEGVGLEIPRPFVGQQPGTLLIGLRMFFNPAPLDHDEYQDVKLGLRSPSLHVESETHLVKSIVGDSFRVNEHFRKVGNAATAIVGCHDNMQRVCDDPLEETI